MGGNALKNCTTRRYDAAEYHQAEMDILENLKMIFHRSRPLPIKSYRAKESFGDCDILIDSSTLPTHWVEAVTDWFRPKEFVKNGNVLSFERRQLQVDLIVTKPEDFWTSYNYFAWNDLGNLLGRIAHSIGLKLGHDGLSYCWRVDTHAFKTEVISRDWEEICGVLGVSFERYCKGFDTLEDIFNFVAASPLFHADIYLLENRNNASRVRDRKRKTYMEFLEWCDWRQHTTLQVQNKLIRDSGDKSVWLPYIFERVDGFEATYNRVQQEWAEATEYKRRFNGDLVSEWTGLKGKELGELMRELKATFTQRRVALLSDETIKTIVDYHVTLREIKKCGGLIRQER